MKLHWKKLIIGALVLGCMNVVAPLYSDDDEKVTICHKGNTIRVGRPAVRAHLDHGDTIGTCEVTPNRNR